MRSGLRHARDTLIAHPACGHCVARGHQRRDCIDENSGAPRSRFLGLLAPEIAALWFLEHDA